MKAVGRWLVVAALVLVVPANETVADGPDSIRRPIIKALIWAGVLEGPGWFGGHPYLPTVGGSETSTKGAGGEEIPTSRMEIKREPVYRALLWPVGDRITYRLRYYGEWRETRRAVRLCYADGDRKVVAADNRSPDPGGQLAEVSGFVPRSARGYRVVYTDDSGETRSIHGWGDTDPFWGD